MSIHCPHTFKNGNQCDDKLVDFGNRSQGYTWWENVPSFICPEFFIDRFYFFIGLGIICGFVVVPPL